LNVFEGAVAVVAGAGPGIGRACASALALSGADVVVAARNEERLHTLARELEAETGRTVQPLVVDLADVASCRALIDRTVAWLGRIDVLVNVATAGGEQ
jgi:NADP-dependent 3-hydroxy acid dehydrogenase YdfG